MYRYKKIVNRIYYINLFPEMLKVHETDGENKLVENFTLNKTTYNCRIAIILILN